MRTTVATALATLTTRTGPAAGPGTSSAAGHPDLGLSRGPGSIRERASRARLARRRRSPWRSHGRRRQRRQPGCGGPRAGQGPRDRPWALTRRPAVPSAAGRPLLPDACLRAGLTCEHGEVRVTRLVTLDD